MPARGRHPQGGRPGIIDPCGGLFVAVEGDDPEFAARFPEHCRSAGIECSAITPAEARTEPCLSERVIAAYTVPNATVDPFRVTLENVNHAQQLTQSIFLSHTELERFVVDGGTIRSAICRIREAVRRRPYTRARWSTPPAPGPCGWRTWPAAPASTCSIPRAP